MLTAFRHENASENNLAFRSSRPTYAIILLALSSLLMCSPAFVFCFISERRSPRSCPGFGRAGTAAPEAVAVVQETVAAAGPLTRTVPVAYYSGGTVTARVNGSQTFKKNQASYIAWFQRHPKPLLLIITRYEADRGQRAYEINEGEAMLMVRGYALPVLLFGVWLLTSARKKSPDFTATAGRASGT